MSSALLAAACRDIYCDDLPKRRGLLGNLGRVVVDIDGGDAAVVDTADYRVLVYRGTDDWGDWRHNLRRGQRAAKGVPFLRGDPAPPDAGPDESSKDARQRRDRTPGHAHRGFIEALRAYWPAVRDALDEVPPHERVLCGHSLGGALACLTAYWRPCAWIATFGCPRAGDADLAESIAANATLIDQHEARMDPVTWVPILGYEHVYAEHERAQRIGVASWGHSMAGYAEAVS